MIGLGVVVLVALVAFGMWTASRGHDGGRSEAKPGRTEVEEARPAGAPALPRGDFAADLERWVAAGLISSEQAGAIRAHERERAAARVPAPERRISLIAEALGYVGTALALAGAAVGLGQAWDDIPGWGRLAAAGGATVLLWLGGLILLRQSEPAFRRLQSVLWFLAVGAAVWFLVVLGIEYLGLSDDERLALLVGAGSAVLAGLLWAFRRLALQHAALFGTLLVTLVGIVLCLPGRAPIWGFGLAVWALGVAWGVAGWFRGLEPWWLAVALGSATAVIGPSVGIGDYSWLLALGLGTSALLMAVSVPSGQVPLLAVGTLGTFGYLTWAVFHFFGDSLPVALVLVIVGAVFIALAVVAGRLTQATRGRRRRRLEEPTAG